MSLPNQNLRLRRRDPKAAPCPAFSDDPLLARLYAARTRSPEDLDYRLESLPPPEGIPGMRRAAERLASAVLNGERIVISGDYDADGATASALCMRILREFGANVRYFVPDRMTMGYGLTPGSFAALCREGRPDLVVTVDNGISSVVGARSAREAGVDLIITDHHLPGEQLPDWGWLVNPNLEAGSPYGSLAGVGVAFYLMAATRTVLRDRGHFRGGKAPSLSKVIELVALGTVADVVPLDRINRTLVEHGLRRLRAGLASPGVSALARVAGRDLETLTASDFGFGLGPRLNAAGRLENMRVGIECLLAETPGVAQTLAEQLNEINEARKAREADMRAEAEAMIESADLDSAASGGAVCLYGEGWHEGVVGLIASRIKERLNRPVAAFAASRNGVLKGSVRSIPGVHIRDVLARVDALHPGVIERFGGHAMAAGLSLPAGNLDAFRDAFTQAVNDLAESGAFDPVRVTDGELAPDEITIDQARRLRYAGPWGQGFPEPVFDGIFEIYECRPLSEGRHARFRANLQGSDLRVEAIAFNTDAMILPPGLGRRRLIYALDVNRYQGLDGLQLRVIDSLDPRLAPEDADHVSAAPR